MTVLDTLVRHRLGRDLPGSRRVMGIASNALDRALSREAFGPVLAAEERRARDEVERLIASVQLGAYESAPEPDA